MTEADRSALRDSLDPEAPWNLSVAVADAKVSRSTARARESEAVVRTGSYLRTPKAKAERMSEDLVAAQAEVDRLREALRIATERPASVGLSAAIYASRAQSEAEEATEAMLAAQKAYDDAAASGADETEIERLRDAWGTTVNVAGAAKRRLERAGG